MDGDLAPATVKRLANNIYRASRRIQELLQDLVNTSRGKADSAEMCCLRDLIAAACEPLLPVAQAQNTDIRIDLPETWRLPWRGLGSNGCSSIYVQIRWKRWWRAEIRISGAQQNGSALIRVEDTGPVFRGRFAKSYSSHLRLPARKTGCGLGLALSRQTVLAHGGDLWAEAVEHGAAFCVRLPLEPEVLKLHE